MSDELGRRRDHVMVRLCDSGVKSQTAYHTRSPAGNWFGYEQIFWVQRNIPESSSQYRVFYRIENRYLSDRLGSYDTARSARLL